MPMQARCPTDGPPNSTRPYRAPPQWAWPCPLDGTMCFYWSSWVLGLQLANQLGDFRPRRDRLYYHDVASVDYASIWSVPLAAAPDEDVLHRSEEHTSELQ